MFEENNYKIFGGCLHPVKTHNKWTGEEMFCACGKCSACLNASASKQSSRVRKEIESHSYSVMFTLTYDNAHVPLWQIFSDTLGYPQICPVGRVSDMYNCCPLNYFDAASQKWNINSDTVFPIVENLGDNHVFACVCKKDVQNFMKRVRFHINKLDISSNEKKIRYYISSEYGPKTYRPHYHGIFFFDNAVILREIADIIVKSWGFFERRKGRVNSFTFLPYADIRLTRENVKICDVNTAYYVAEYVAGNSGLPQVLAYKSTRPFHIQSKSPVIGSYKSNRKKILECVDRGTYRTCERRFNEKLGQFELYDIPLDRDISNSIFRKCKGYSDLSFDKKLQLYIFYSSHHAEWRRELEIYKSVVDTSLDDAGFLRKHRYMKYRVWLKEHYPNEYLFLDMDTEQNWYCSRHAWRMSKILDLNEFYPYVDFFHAYVKMMDRYETLRKSDQMIQFYETFNSLVEHVGFQPAMLDAYPLMYDNIPSLKDAPPGNVYSRVFLDELCETGDFYSFGFISSDKLYHNSLCSTHYFSVYVRQQQKKLDKRNKSKKINNSRVYNYRKID